MSAIKNKQIRNAHAKNYIEAVFANLLRAEGFNCPDDKLLCWYRVVNKEVVHSVCFFSRWPNVPLMMEIAYGVHPLFLSPFRSTDVYISNRPDDERFYTATIQECGPTHQFAPYSQEILVYAPKLYGRGLYTLEHVILPQMNAVQTTAQCYRFHRQKSAERSGSLTSTMIDEAIYLNDTTAYLNCRRTVDRLIGVYLRNCELQPTKKIYKEILLQLQQQKQTLVDGKREEYLAILEQRAKRTINWLDKVFCNTV